MGRKQEGTSSVQKVASVSAIQKIAMTDTYHAPAQMQMLLQTVGVVEVWGKPRGKAGSNCRPGCK